MDRDRIRSLLRLIVILLGISFLLPACVSTGGGTASHVDAKLRERGI